VDTAVLMRRYAWDASARLLNTVYDDVRPREAPSAALSGSVEDRNSSPKVVAGISFRDGTEVATRPNRRTT
jgi:hypothetical protein